MADGADWWLPRPRVGLSLRPRPGGGTALVPGSPDPTLAPLYDRLLRASDNLEAIKARMDIVRALLLANYDLGDDHLARLLTWEPGDPASDAVLAGWTRHVFPASRADDEASAGDEDEGPDGGDGRPKA